MLSRDEHVDGKGTTLVVAEKVLFSVVLKGRGFLAAP
jgi:hypothetical protein